MVRIFYIHSRWIIFWSFNNLKTSEGELMISEYDAVKKILDRHGITDIDDLEYGRDAFDDLIDYFADEMPYGVMKARTGMPDEWIYDKLCDLGFDKEFA